MLERDVVNKIRIALKAAGIRYVRKNIGNMHSSGRVDLELVTNGILTGIEVKRDEKCLRDEVTALQWEEIEAIQAAGGVAFAATICGGRGKYNILLRYSQKESTPIELELNTWAQRVAAAQQQLRVIDYIRRGQSQTQ